MTKRILKKYNIKAKKGYGQNFLIDDKILENIVKLSDIDDKILVIEIGPGLGNLTYYLQEYNLLLIEIDKQMIEVLEDRLKGKNNIRLINVDILKLDIDNLIKNFEESKNIYFKEVKVVANLPYYITSPIIFKLLEESKRVTELVIMVQDEVANRIVAKKGNKDYGILTLLIKYFANATKEIVVPNSSFIPIPKVTSSVVKIKRKKYNDVDYNIFKDLIHKAFACRRKKLVNSLVQNNFMNLNKDEISNLLKSVDISDSARAEEIDFLKFIHLVKRMS